MAVAIPCLLKGELDCLIKRPSKKGRNISALFYALC